MAWQCAMAHPLKMVVTLQDGKHTNNLTLCFLYLHIVHDDKFMCTQW